MTSLVRVWGWPGRLVLLCTILLGQSAALLATDAQQSVAVDVTQHIVYTEGLQFTPDRLEVSIGDKITWINKDIVPHTASALDGSWDSEGLSIGKQFTLVVTAGMATDYFCRYHPSMIAQVVLLDSLDRL